LLNTALAELAICSAYPSPRSTSPADTEP
jgi:hypothetical protein